MATDVPIFFNMKEVKEALEIFKLEVLATSRSVPKIKY